MYKIDNLLLALFTNHGTMWTCSFIIILKGVAFYLLSWIINDELGGMEMTLMAVWDPRGKCTTSQNS